MDEMQQVIVVMAVLIGLGASLWVLRSKGMVKFGVKGLGGANARSLESLERLPLTAQHSLHLVRVAERIVLIAVSPQGCSILDGVGESEGRLAQ